MKTARPYAGALDRLKASGLRPTRQRIALAKLLFERGDRHVTADALHAEAAEAKVRVALATVYNTLHQFTKVGLLREVAVDSGRSYFDTNTAEHHHAYVEDTGQLHDIPVQGVNLDNLPPTPAGTEIARVDVIVRLRGGGGR